MVSSSFRNPRTLTTGGRLEVYLRGEWGTVCSKFFSRAEADVACRQLGYSDALDYGDSLGYTACSICYLPTYMHWRNACEIPAFSVDRLSQISSCYDSYPSSQLVLHMHALL